MWAIARILHFLIFAATKARAFVPFTPLEEIQDCLEVISLTERTLEFSGKLEKDSYFTGYFLLLYFLSSLDKGLADGIPHPKDPICQIQRK